MSSLGKYSFGMGDRFAHQAEAQLQAIIKAEQAGVHITPVWNKSYREHITIGSEPEQTRAAADNAVRKLGWKADYFTDADHITAANVDFFLNSSDFYTIDVADYIGRSCDPELQADFISRNRKYLGKLDLQDLQEDVIVTEASLEAVAGKYLFATREAGKLYRYIASKLGGRQAVIEVSMDETDLAQTPDEIFLILAALAQEQVPVNTIAPKFSGRFNKGVDYIGDTTLFRKEFEQDVAVLALAIAEFGMDQNLKLSIHSGSDKFSIYPIMREVITRYDTGIHVKTAGTTWLEELIGLAEAGAEGLVLAKDVYRLSLERYTELCRPYATVLDIDKQLLPDLSTVLTWDGPTFARALRHDQQEPDYNLNFRQLLHVGYKIAAEMGSSFTDALEKYHAIIGRHVTQNLFERHIQRLFL